LSLRIAWTPQAADDLENITDYLFERNPSIATDVVRQIYNAPLALKKFPHRGRPGRKEDTRELVLSPLPYIIVYEIVSNTIRLLRILHAAQQWP
jgi:toxin ParE1/3/4